MTDTPAPARRPTGRSPSFPAISLETAVRRARELYETERQHPTSVETIVRHWGYKSMNGPASLSLAALKKFGLLTDEGRGTDRRGRLTHLAVDIVANPDAAARTSAIKQAALMPVIHKELWDKYQNNPPSDANLQWDLVRQRGFTESGAADFIREYKQTVTFAQLDASDEAADMASDDDDGHDEDIPGVNEQPKQYLNRVVGAQSNATRFPIPVFHGKTVVIEGEFPLSDEDWNQFMTVLGVMKPALVIRPVPD